LNAAAAVGKTKIDSTHKDRDRESKERIEKDKVKNKPKGDSSGS